MSPLAEEARRHLLRDANRAIAVDTANLLVNDLLDRLDDTSDGKLSTPRTNAVTSLLTRAMIARALIGVASAWMADLVEHLPRPAAHEALLSIMVDPPAWMDHEEILDEGDEA